MDGYNVSHWLLYIDNAFYNFSFLKWWSFAILDLFGAYLDHPRRVFGGFYRCAKFGCNRCSSFDNMKVSIFCAFSLKTPIHRLKEIPPLKGVQ